MGGALGLLALLLAAGSLFIFPQDRFPQYFKLSAYPLYMLTFGWAIWAWIREEKPATWAARLREQRWALLVAVLLGLHIALTVPSGFQVLGDEGTLLSTAKSLYFERVPIAEHRLPQRFAYKSMDTRRLGPKLGVRILRVRATKPTSTHRDNR